MPPKVDEWLVKVKELMSNSDAFGDADWMFYPVPRELRMGKEDCRDHRHISLGLFNRDFEIMSPADLTRVEVAKMFVQVYGGTLGTWDDICLIVVEEPSKQRKRYGHMAEMSDRVVQHLLTLDAVFLVCYLVTLYFMSKGSEHCPLEKMRLLLQLLWRSVHTSHRRLLKDIMLLENQIALELMLKVVEIMVSAETLGEEEISSEIMVNPAIADSFISIGSVLIPFGHLHLWLLYNIMTMVTIYEMINLPGGCQFAKEHLQMKSPTILLQLIKFSSPPCPINVVANQPRHLLHHLHEVVTFESMTRENLDVTSSFGWDVSNSKYSVPTATDLRKAGITIKHHSGGVSDVKLERSRFGATLSLPVILVSDETERSLRNLAAYEQLLFTHEDSSIDCDFQHYLFLMDRLINTPADVAVLVNCKVLVCLGNEVEISGMWNRIAQGLLVYREESKWTKLFYEINERYAYCKPRLGLLLELQEKYFSRPWLVISVVAGTALLVLTFLQTFYAVRGGS